MTDAGTTDAGNDVTTQKDTGSDVKSQGQRRPTRPYRCPSHRRARPTSSTSDASDAGDAGDAGLMYTLTINDYINWCNVSVNGQDAGSTPGTYQFAPDASVSLHGDTKDSNTFYWGYWQAPTLADGGKDTTMDVSLTMNGNVTILACCPFNNTSLSCP